MFSPLTSEFALIACLKRTALGLVFLGLLLGAVTTVRAVAQSGSRNLEKPQQVAAQATSTGGYYALVIGIDEYPKPIPPLKTAVHDAEEIARVLRDRYGFQVRLLRNGEATREKILGALTTYETAVGGDDHLLIYYAGHGVKNTAANKSYWLPSDADSAQSSNRISADDLSSEIANMRARHVLVISDSCYSGGLAREIDDPMLSHGQEAFLRKMLMGKSRNLMASGRDEPVADGGPDGHSIFAYAIIKALEDEAEQMFTASDLFYGMVQRRVAGNADQVPQYATIRNSGDEAGDFVFRRAGLTGVEEQHKLADPAAGYDRALAFYKQKSFSDAMREVLPLCNAGDARACNLLGDMYGRGEGLTPDYARAVALYRKACDGGYARGCSKMGFMYEKGRSVAIDLTQAAALYQKGCDGEDAYGCSGLGYLYDTGKGVATDLVHAAALYQKGCDGGDALGCSNLGNMYEKGRGVAIDLAQAVAFSRKGCSGGNAFGCSHLGYFYEVGKGVVSDLPQAVALYRKGCDDGNAFGCRNLSLMFENGKAVPINPAESVAVYRKACDGGYGRSCSTSGSMYENGKGAPVDFKQAVELYRKACDGGDAPSCSNFGSMYENGRGVPVDSKQAVALYRKACDGKDSLGCFKLGAMYENGKGVAVDLKQAWDFYHEGCDLPGGHGCFDVGALFESGKFVPINTINLARASAYYDQACANGDARGCSSSGRMAKNGGSKYEAEKAFRKGCHLGDQQACNELKALQP